MFVLGNLFITLGSLLQLVTNLYIVVIIISAILTWIPDLDPTHPVHGFFRRLTEPVYARVRSYLPAPVWNNSMGVDLTPLIVILALWLLNGVVFESIIDIGHRLR